MSMGDTIEGTGLMPRARRTAAIAISIVGHYSWPARRAVAGVRRRPDRTLHAVAPGDLPLTLRMPRLADGPEWRRARLADQARIERFWVSEPGDWERQHSDRAWAHHCLAAWSRARTGIAYERVVDIDGTLVGQCGLWVEESAGRGELGGWLSERWSGRGIAATAMGATLDFGFGELGLSRIVAPIDAENDPMIRVARRLGFVCEGTMAKYLEAAGRRRDSQLWAITDDMWAARQSTPPEPAPTEPKPSGPES